MLKSLVAEQSYFSVYIGVSVRPRLHSSEFITLSPQQTASALCALAELNPLAELGSLV